MCQWGYPLLVRQPRLPPKKAERGGRGPKPLAPMLADGFAYLNHCRLCPLTRLPVTLVREDQVI
jgi:hypothetical protein